MTITANKTTWLLLFLTTLLSACASNDIYRSQFSPCKVTMQQSCESYAIQHHNDATKKEFLLSFVEIDDQGQLRNRAQMDALITELANAAAKESLLINVFVHGWHHNAKPGDPNIESFKESLAQLSEIDRSLHEHPRKVVGVYVGWRGESIDVPVLNNLTFWDRKNTARKVGHLGVAELLLRLEEIRNVKNTQKPQLKSRLVILGHSFGGSVVYSATAQILADRFIDSRGDKSFVDTAKGFGDLVVCCSIPPSKRSVMRRSTIWHMPVAATLTTSNPCWWCSLPRLTRPPSISFQSGAAFPLFSRPTAASNATTASGR